MRRSLLLALLLFSIESSAESQKTFSLNSELGLLGGFGSSYNSDKSIPNRAVDVGELYLTGGVRYMGTTLFLLGEYRDLEQMSDVSSSDNQNLGGNGYLFGLGLNFEIYKVDFSFSYQFYGAFAMRNKTTLGESSIYSNPAGYRLQIGHLIYPRIKGFIFVNDLDFKSWDHGGTDVDISDNKLTQLTYGVGIALHVFN